MRNLKAISFSLFPFFFSLGIAGADAQQYPSRSIRLIMPNAPGSSADTMGRTPGMPEDEITQLITGWLALRLAA